MVNRKNRCDFFYFTAKKFKFRSRAAFKLIELNKKFSFLENASGILDLCAAPGSWMQVARHLAPLCAPIIGIDIYPIKALKGCTTLKGDITSPSCSNSVSKILNKFGQQINIVLHDGSPKMGSKWLSDVYKQNELVLNAFKLIRNFLIYSGWFVTKIFKSEHFNNLFFILKFFFKKIFIFKPIASRNSSTEIYLVCKEYFKNSIKYNLLLEPNFTFKEPVVYRKKLNTKNYLELFNHKKNLSILLKKNDLFYLKKKYSYQKKDEDECVLGTDFYGAKFFEKETIITNVVFFKIAIFNWLKKNI
jgi:AdoMet-dependent rRNA methyltransferase SPB1